MQPNESYQCIIAFVRAGFFEKRLNSYGKGADTHDGPAGARTPGGRFVGVAHGGDKMNHFSESDVAFMREAIALAAKGLGTVSPNPPVGCVIVKQNEVVGRGYHQKFGEAHAEVNAIADALGNTDGGIAGATAYVTLAPCNHYGKTPPCTEALVRAGISRVVVAVEDPNPVSGGGLEFLRGKGITVETGLLTADAAKVMAGFLKFYRAALPHLRLKYAMTLDGKIAARDGNSQWISCERSRDYVQTLRMQSDAILVGAGTALRDQPRLNVRNVALPQPKRVIADSRLRLTPEMPLFSHTGGEFIVFHALEKPEGKAAALEKIGVKVIPCPGDDGKVDLYQALKALARDHGVRNVLCEGGATLNAALVHKKLADSAAVFIAPKILGGSGIAPMESATAYPLANSPRLVGAEIKTFDDDLYVHGDIVYPT